MTETPGVEVPSVQLRARPAVRVDQPRDDGEVIGQFCHVVRIGMSGPCKGTISGIALLTERVKPMATAFSCACVPSSEHDVRSRREVRYVDA
jgi:hypothetical protein